MWARKDWVGFICCIYWCVLIGCVSASSSATAASLPRIDIGQLQEQWLREPVEFVVLDEHLALEDVQAANFQPLTGHSINQGIRDQIYWLRFRLYNDGPAAKSWILQNDTSYLDNLVVYHRDQHAEQFTRRHLSDRQPFHTRDIDYRNLSFGHSTEAGAYTDIYLQLYYDKADSISLNFHLWDEAVFWDAARDENLIYGIYYGILAALVLLSLTFAVLLRQLNALYYAVFLLSTGAMWLMLNGYAFQYLWPNSVYWHNEGFHIFFLLFALFALQFSKAFLRTRSIQPRVHRFFTALQVVAVASLALRASGEYRMVLDLAFGMLFLLAFIIPIASWRAYRKGLSYARWYTVAWLIYSISLLICVVSAYTDMLQWGMQVLNYMQTGSLLEALFLMVAMSEWLLSLDRDRRKALALANQDPLTRLGNRRLLQVQYEHYREQFHKDGQPVFLIMMDLDFFKQINDTHGHEAGDYVLKEVAVMLKEFSRDGDVCTRYGGEEFAVLLRADNIEAVWQVAERIRQQFASRPTTYNNQVIEHTLSSGITQVLSKNEILSVQEMMCRADAALYQAKSAGRNISVIYDNSTLCGIAKPF